MNQPLPPAPGGLSFQHLIQKVGNTKRPQSIAVIAKHKQGKTTLAASAIEIPALKQAGKGVLILEAEKGTAAIADDYPDVDLVPVNNFHDLNRMIFDELLVRHHNYGVITLDTFDKFQEYAVDVLVTGQHDTQAGWGKVKKWTNDVLWALHKSDLLSIALFHETQDKDQKSGAITTTFKLQGSAKDDIGQIFDIIGRLTVDSNETGELHRYLQLGPLAGHVTGNRYERQLPAVMVDPSMPAIFDLILPSTPANQQ